ncbi:MAG: hypothetical protein AB7E24_25140 [Novosphingobium sp.]
MTFTLNDIALLILALLIGFVLGLMVSGRGKYKGLWRSEQRAHREAVEERDARIAAANERISALEHRSEPIGPGTAAAVAGAAAHGRDDLTHIRGISDQDEISLNEAGYHRYSQIATLNVEQQAMLEARLGREPGLIAHDQWPEQARLLEKGEFSEHERLYHRRATGA